ncbi:DUF427 domain-containing protein [Undibacterium sp.]|jgi:uncharacterized protein (DUF427 family)|uniref:DUF427 domain-containing protein n=1 Tax=Undibacterium sp. TaxID=1914977 RepID=UPI002C5631EC|nr:DUF427 domain-containing protein [Undibacterium sp.]HTD03051.1 DUF427 domain-containing protein [Undibacterium sp.]
MPTARWNGVVIAEAASDQVKIVEGNVYFPENSVNPAYLQASEKKTICAWKGVASYYDVVVGGKANQDAAWTYRTPKDAAKEIIDHIAFWHGVEVRR